MEVIMAGAVVHKEFFKECIAKVNLYNIDDENNMNIFAQGHDLLLYITPLKLKKYRNISLVLSNYKFKEFVYTYLKTAFENGIIYQDKSIRSFLYGYISHHILDSYFHPFIMQYAFDYLPVKKTAWLHGEIETLYDTLFIVKKLGLIPKNYKIYEDFRYHGVISEPLIATIDTAVYKTYGIKNCGKLFKKAFHLNSEYVRLYRYDPKGIKKKFAIITNPIFKLGADKFFCDETELSELEKYINNNHFEWLNIWNNTKSNDSFCDIYSKAMHDTTNSINQIEIILERHKLDKIVINDILPDRSAITGTKCGMKLPFINYNSD